MKTFVAALLVATISAKGHAKWNSDDLKWIDFLTKHQVAYKTVYEFIKRKEIFDAVDEQIEVINSVENSTFKAAHNKFSTWTDEEFQATLALKNESVATTLKELDLENYVEEKVSNAQLPTFDWRDQGKVTPVKEQGSCASSWAFSAVGAIESALMIAGNPEVRLSEQYLMDCSSTDRYNNHGCQGGWYLDAYDYLRYQQTIMKEDDVPYKGYDAKCSDHQGEEVITYLTGFERSLGTQENLLRLTQTPLNVAVAAGNIAFRSYSSGIITESSGCGDQVDHAALAVGFGVENDIAYYIVRNSWGTDWGEDGYVRIAMGGGRGVCGINQYVFQPNFGARIQVE